MKTSDDPVAGADRAFGADGGCGGRPGPVVDLEPRFVDALGARWAILTDRQRDRLTGMAVAHIERLGEATLTMRDIREYAGIVVAYEWMDRSKTG